MGTCTLLLTVNGTIAAANLGNTCIFKVAVGGTTVPVTVSITSWTITTVDGGTATVSGTATGVGGLADGCPVNIAGSATKQSPRTARPGEAAPDVAHLGYGGHQTYHRMKGEDQSSFMNCLAVLLGGLDERLAFVGWYRSYLLPNAWYV